MRIPLHQLHRAFFELDDFTDEQCSRLMSRSTRQRDSDIAAASFIWGAGGYVAIALSVTAVIVVAHSLGVSWSQSTVGRIYRQIGRGDVDELCFVAVILAVFVGVAPLILARDASLRCALRLLIARTSCPACGKTLLGARRTQVSVTCDSCRAEHSFHALKIVPDDLGPPLFHLTPNARCPGCSYPVTGLRIHRGDVTCPECGHVLHVADDPGPHA